MNNGFGWTPETLLTRWYLALSLMVSVLNECVCVVVGRVGGVGGGGE